MGNKRKKTLIGMAFALCAMFITTSAQQFIYQYKDGEVIRKDTLFVNDGVVANEGKIQIIKKDQVAYEISADEVDSLAFAPLIKLKKNQLTLLLSQDSKSIDFTCSPTGDLKPEDLIWSSSNESVATVSNGVVSPIAVGTCLIEGKYGNRTITCSVNVKEAANYYYVDLGLPSGILWASCNVGATSPEEAGDHFLWGETEPTESPTKSFVDDYKLYLLTTNELINLGFFNENEELMPEYDAATVNMGIDWRLPNDKEWNELTSNTTKTKDSINGVFGYRFTGATGASIFLPVAGYYSTRQFDEEHVTYWSSNTNSQYVANGFSFSSNTNSMGSEGSYREYSCSVRAVQSSSSVSRIKISKGLRIPGVHQTAGLSFSSKPQNSVAASEVQWSSSDENVATVKEGKVTSVSEGKCVITAIYNNQIAQCEVTVDQNAYVDLGLPSGTLWASYNIGATEPKEWGYMLKWGYTSPGLNSENGYGWNFYKYDDFLNNGIIDERGNLTADYDAAKFNWGEIWMMPSMAHFQELFNECDLSEVELDGVLCTKVTSRTNGASIYLPAAGYRYVDGSVSGKDIGYYRTSTMRNRNGNNFAYTARVAAGRYEIGLFMREYYGMSVRPIYASTADYKITLSLDQKELNLTTANSTKKVSFSTSPANALTADDITWSSSNQQVAFVNKGIIVPLSAGSCEITAEYRGEKSKCTVNVTTAAPNIVSDEHEYVDLGLPSGTLWARTNIGAQRETDYGDYFSWGEFETKENYSAFESPWYNVTASELLALGVVTETKIDEENVTYKLSPKFDAATRNWGEDWRMPTSKEYEELYENCTRDIVFKTINGESRRLTVYKSNKNGALIYFPYSGYQDDGLREIEYTGVRWSSDFYTPSKIESYAGTSSSYRGYGYAIRPVRVVKTE